MPEAVSGSFLKYGNPGVSIPPKGETPHRGNPRRPNVRGNSLGQSLKEFLAFANVRGAQKRRKPPVSQLR